MKDAFKVELMTAKDGSREVYSVVVQSVVTKPTSDRDKILLLLKGLSKRLNGDPMNVYFNNGYLYDEGRIKESEPIGLEAKRDLIRYLSENVGSDVILTHNDLRGRLN